MAKEKKCLMCSKALNPEGECPNGCTEDPAYDVQVGVDLDATDVIIKSLASGRCFHCGDELSCEQGCYSPASYDNDTESNTALELGVCLDCGEKVSCHNQCF